MTRRLLDVVLAAIALTAAAPLLLVAAIGILLASSGPVLYRAPRVGRRGTRFIMYKLRTMYVDQGGYRSVITAEGDPRIFPFGLWLRRTKIDELPQLFNVLRGDMAIVGPRPEHPDIVERYYTAPQRETLALRPGLTSPGSIYSYTHGEKLLGRDDPELCYVQRLLPVRLALDLAYGRRASLRYDLAIIARTLWVIAATLLGKSSFSDPRELQAAFRLLGEEGPLASPVPSDGTGGAGCCGTTLRVAGVQHPSRDIALMDD